MRVWLNTALQQITAIKLLEDCTRIVTLRMKNKNSSFTMSLSLYSRKFDLNSIPPIFTVQTFLRWFICECLFQGDWTQESQTYSLNISSSSRHRVNANIYKLHVPEKRSPHKTLLLLKSEVCVIWQKGKITL